jgi:hypothetical protein
MARTTAFSQEEYRYKSIENNLPKMESLYGSEEISSRRMASNAA